MYCARIIQTSTVYGGAGADTLILGESANFGQMVDVDINALAGMTVAVTGSFVSAMSKVVMATAINLAIDYASGEAQQVCTYAGDGADSLIVAGRASPSTALSDSTDGADTLSLSNLYSSTVYGASGADSFAWPHNRLFRIEVGTDASTFNACP